MRRPLNVSDLFAAADDIAGDHISAGRVFVIYTQECPLLFIMFVTMMVVIIVVLVTEGKIADEVAIVPEL